MINNLKEKQTVALMIVKTLTSEMHNREEALKKVPLNINDTLSSIQTQIKLNLERIGALELDLKSKVSK